MTDKTAAEQAIAFGESLADPNFCLSVPGEAKTGIRNLLTLIERQAKRIASLTLCSARRHISSQDSRCTRPDTS